MRQGLITLILFFYLSLKEYVSELEEGRMELSKNNGMLKDEIKTLKKEKKEVENALSIIEVIELFLQFHLHCMCM